MVSTNNFSFKKKLCLILSIGIILLNVNSLSQPTLTVKQTTIAVIDFEAMEGIKVGEAKALSDAFSAQLVQSEDFRVVERGKINTILIEQGFQQSEACSAIECAVEVGRILKAEMIITGRIGKVQSYYNLNVQAIDVTTGQILFTANETIDDIEDLLIEKIPEMAENMISSLSGKDTTPSIFLRHEVSMGFGGGGTTEEDIFKAPIKVKTSPEIMNTASYRYNLSENLAVGAHVTGFTQTINDIPITDTSTGTPKNVNFDLSCIHFGIEGRWILLRGLFEPYCFIGLNTIIGSLTNKDLGDLAMSGFSGGGGIGTRIAFTKNWIGSIEFFGYFGKAKWNKKVFVNSTGDGFDPALYGVLITASYQWGRP
jgi:TolB-like protein